MIMFSMLPPITKEPHDVSFSSKLKIPSLVCENNKIKKDSNAPKFMELKERT